MNNRNLMALLAVAFISQITHVFADTTFRFKLDKSGRTSAGVYKMDGTLIRALWKKKPLSAGLHRAQWDNKDEAGVVQPTGNYQIKLIAHNINYVWDGVLGNTSSRFTGSTVHHGSRPAGMAITGTSAFYASGYNEGQPLWRRFSTNSPQSVGGLGRVDFTRDFNYVAADDTNVYYANTGNGWLGDAPDNWPSFIVAHKVSDNSEFIFSSGAVEPATKNPSRRWESVIDRQTGQGNGATGLAVQYHTGGTFLAVAHNALNQVRLFNKTTGAFIKSISVTNPRGIAFAPNGDLWVICSNAGGARVACRYNNLSGTPALVTTVTGFSDPLAIAVDPRSTSNVVAVVDGGTSHQVKGFNSSGTSLWTLGVAGGYANGPAVANDKFWFRQDTLDNTPAGVAAFIAFAPDGSFWIEDKGNRRTMHFSAARAYIENIAFAHTSRIATVDPNNPTRVFSNLLEYQVDYSKPLAPNNGSWTLVRNWGWGDTKAAEDTWGFRAAITLSNGRTYALKGTPNENFTIKLYELQTNTIRDTGIALEDALASGTSIEPDGTLQYQRQVAGRVTFYKKSLSGFDTAGNPQWGAEVTLASAPMGTDDPYYKNYAHSARTKVTESDVVISFDPSNANNSTTSWHLGGVQKDSTDWLWKASRAGWTDGMGAFQSRGIDDSVNSPGNFVDVLGRNVLYGFHGEFWKHREAGGEGVGQANKWMHFYDNGLFVGEFGQPNYFNVPAGSGIGAPAAGMAGNALTWSMVRVPKNNEVYLYHCDEASHSGVHRWRLDGINNITEIVGSGPRDSTIEMSGKGTGLRGEYFDNEDLTDLKTTRIDKTIDFNWGAGKATAEQTDVDTYSVRWTGQVEAPVTGSYTFSTFSDDGIRVWVNNQLLIDKWVYQGPTAWSGTITLTEGQKYPIKVEYFEGGYSTIAQLFWSYSGQAQQIVPKDRLYPPDDTVFGSGLGLTGEYFNDATYSNKLVTRTDAEVDFHWVYEGGVPGQSVDNFTVRWTGEVQAVETGTYTFTVIGDDVMRLWLGNTTGTPLINKTRDTDDPLRESITFAMTAGQKYPIKVEFKEDSGYASARLEWQRPGQLGSTIVPQTQLYPATLTDDLPDGAAGTGLKAQYYSDKNLASLVTTRTDEKIDFNWGSGAAMTSVGPDNFSVRWLGEVQAPATGTYTFTTQSDDGARLWVNNQLLVDKWVDQGFTAWSGSIALAAGQKYPLKMEYFDSGGDAAAWLSWLRPGQGQSEIVPKLQLFPAP